jgi:imidazolonepropionase-like amidohydrolase
MKGRIFAIVVGFVSLMSALVIARVQPATANSQADGALALVGAKIYTSPTEPPIPNATIVIRGGKVEAVGPSGSVSIPARATQITLKNQVITAGFQNSHVHFTEAKWNDAEKLPAAQLSQQLSDMLGRYGFTTAVDLGSYLENTVAIRKRIESGAVPGPRILTAGGGLYPPKGVPFYVREALPPEILKLVPQPPTPEEAVQVVDREIAGGADVVKLFTGSLIEPNQVKLMPEPIAAAAVAEAHRHDRLVFTHPSNIEGAMVAIKRKWTFWRTRRPWQAPGASR